MDFDPVVKSLCTTLKKALKFNSKNYFFLIITSRAMGCYFDRVVRSFGTTMKKASKKN
jgi:hypothetical protein